MKISFVILTWNRYKFLEQCLPALIDSINDPSDCEIIVMDNGSTDNTRDVLKQFENNSLVKIIYRNKNYGLNSYKGLFSKAEGDLIVVVDDDVLQFPANIDTTFIKYMNTFTHYGFVALNVVQNEFTDGAKPGPENYKEETINGMTIEQGPTGGWCACFRKADFKKIQLRFVLTNMNIKNSEDGILSTRLRRRLKLKSGIIKNEICFHACGPYYAQQYDHLDREIEKYAYAGLQNYVDRYSEYK
jgi:glycosyltransferase involved in cell wall biosynthesis